MKYRYLRTVGEFELQRCLLSFLHCSGGGGGKVPLSLSASHCGIPFVPFSLGCPGFVTCCFWELNEILLGAAINELIENHCPD